jgi:hypothetical protein
MNSKLIWQILNSITIALLALVMLIFFGIMPFDYMFVPLIFSGLFLSFFLLMNWYYLKRGSIVFFFVAFLGAIGYEIFAKYHHFFTYQEGLVLSQNIPICVILTWFAFLSHIHHYNNGFLTFLGFEKPKKRDENIKLLAILIIADGLQTAILGQVLDFTLVKTGFWIWDKSIVESSFHEWYVGAFFLIIGTLVSLVFRLFEYFSNAIQIKRPMENYLSFNITHLLSLLLGIGTIVYHFEPFYLINIIILALNVIVFDFLFKRNKLKP